MRGNDSWIRLVKFGIKVKTKKSHAPDRPTVTLGPKPPPGPYSKANRKAAG